MNKQNSFRRLVHSHPGAYVVNMLMAYVVMMLCRIVYVALNWSSFHEAFSQNDWGSLLTGCWMFDTSALLYLNALFLLLLLFPCHLKETPRYHRFTRGVYVFCNALGIVANLADAVYFPFTGRRTTATVFSEFSNEGNLADIFGTELVGHWYLVVLFVGLVWAMRRCYFLPKAERPLSLRSYYTVSSLCLLLAAGLTVGGMRGGFTKAVRPITLSNANQYVQRPADAAIVLNTPFSIIRTIGKKPFVDPKYFDDPAEVAAIFSPEHYPSDSLAFTPRNVVVIIGESLGREYIGELNNRGECGPDYAGYTPFLDSLCRHAFTTDYSFSNGRKSIDGMPSVLSAIPMFVEPFFLTSASLNDVGGLARSLGHKGYTTAFFHGAQNGSMGFQAFSQATGFARYYGRTEYDADPEFGGERDFDGTWAIWDEPFLQFYAKQMSQLREPFMTAVFTASSHHPFVIPEQYRDTFPEEGIVMHKCIRYLDHSLRRFFERAAREPWFPNTLFVITGDHTNLTEQPYYQTDLGLFCSPFIIYDPSGELVPPQRRHAIAQQIDIMPTVLSALHYDEPYVAFGCDLLSTPDSLTWAVNYNNGIYQYVQDSLLLQFDGQRPTALYDFRHDWYLQHNLLSAPVPEASASGQNAPVPEASAPVPEASASGQDALTARLKALIQDYMQRMNENRLILK